MKEVKLKQIKIGDRFRKDVGDLSTLSDSIMRLGLLQPIVVDTEYNLIAGYRRYLVFVEMDEDTIPCNVITDFDDREKRTAEMEENTIRKDFTNTEIHAIAQWFHAAESKSGKRTDLEDEPDKDEPRTDSVQGSDVSDKEEDQQPEKPEPEPEKEDRPIDKAAKAVDKSPDTIRKINQIMEAESDIPLIQKQIDALKGRIDDEPVDRLYKELQKLLKPKTEEPNYDAIAKTLVHLIKKQDDGKIIIGDLKTLLKASEGIKELKKYVSRNRSK